MSDLKEAADRFAKDILGMNITGLMLTLTPNAMAKAMTVQQQLATAGGPGAGPRATEYGVALGMEREGSTPVEIMLRNGDGEVTIETVWTELDGVWKVDDFALKR